MLYRIDFDFGFVVEAGGGGGGAPGKCIGGGGGLGAPGKFIGGGGVVARTQMLPGDLWVQVKQVEVFFASRFCGPYLSLLLQWNSVFVEVVVVIEASCVWLHLRK